MNRPTEDFRKSLSELQGRIPKFYNLLSWIGRAVATVIDAFVFPVLLVIKGVNLFLRSAQEKPLPPPRLAKLHDPVAAGSEASVSRDDVDTLVKIGVSAFKEIWITQQERESLYHCWYRTNPSVFSFIVTPIPGHLDSRRAGYTVVIPLKRSAFRSYRRGELSDLKFSEEHIVSPQYTRPVEHICIQAFVLRRRAHRMEWNALYHSLARHIARYNWDFDEVPPRLLAEGASPSGDKLLRRLGWTCLGMSPTKVPFYELDFHRYAEMPAETRETMLALKSLVRAYGQGSAS